MLKTKLMKVTSLGACMSLLMAVPAFAGTNQGNQGNQNMMQFLPNSQIMQNGQLIKNDQMMQKGQMQQSQEQEQEQLSSAAQYMIGQGILKGNSGGSYSMEDNVKRCDMSLMLMRAFNFDTSSTTEDTSFSDVSQGSYYYQAVSAMQHMGIAQGDGQSFRPCSNMTLEEAILFVERALDAAEIEYDEDDITALFDGRDLSDSATREDVATILYTVLGDDAAALLTGEATTSSAVTYTTDENTAIAFVEDDFNDACNDATAADLSYIKFALPSASYGKLYYSYGEEDQAKVSSSYKYYYESDEDDENALSAVTFVPADDYTGTVKISYTGLNADGDTFTGTIKVTVE